MDGGIRCPSIRCKCEETLPPSHVRAHFLQCGFRPNYIVCDKHGEESSNEDNVGYASTSYEETKLVDNFGSMTIWYMMHTCM